METNLENKLHTIWEIVYKIITPNWSWSWFYLKKYNVVITNYHVASWFKKLCIEDNNKNRYLWNVVFLNPENDIAFIKVENYEEKNVELELEEHELLNSRDEVYVLWYPFWLPFTITKWIISSKNQLINWKNLIQTDAAVNPWNSWWAMVWKNWKLIWVTVSKFSWFNTDNMWFWIPLEFLIDDLKSLWEKTWDSFCIKCNSCKNLIYEKSSFCKKCWNAIDKEIFDELPISWISKTIEEIIQKSWINPIITRTSQEYWTFYFEGKFMRIVVDEDWYISFSTPIFKLPSDNLEDFYNYSLSKDMKLFKLWIYDDEIYLLYRVHISDLLWENKEEYITNLEKYFEKLKIVIKELKDKFKLSWSKYDKN